MPTLDSLVEKMANSLHETDHVVPGHCAQVSASSPSRCSIQSWRAKAETAASAADIPAMLRELDALQIEKSKQLPLS